ncbi:MAG TPA: hypothetical protein VK612_07910 [Pyrinomonadaceae bacterium]|nr:hypothetical protein [Pyrinomonadaceae bacterium]
MKEIYCIDAEVTFISASNGGRKTLPSILGCVYRPHIVIGDPEQRQPNLTDGNYIEELMLGVCFVSGPSIIEFKKKFIAQMGLIYWPSESYDSVISGATFTIREGGTIVGFGRVLDCPRIV